jgi:hypothetical protein
VQVHKLGLRVGKALYCTNNLGRDKCWWNNIQISSVGPRLTGSVLSAIATSHQFAGGVYFSTLPYCRVDQTKRLRLVASCASQQYDLSEEAGCVAGIRFVFSIADGKGYGVVRLQFNLP